MLGEAKAVQRLFDAQTNRVGIRPVKRGKRHSYALVHPANSQRRAISGRGFLKTHGFKEDDKGKFKTQTFEAKQKNNMVVFSLKK